MEKLFGSVVLPERTGNFEPGTDVLRTRLAEGEAAHVFCEGCGTHTPVTEQGAAALSSRAEDSPADWKTNYIRVYSCIWCGESFAEPEILPLP